MSVNVVTCCYSIQFIKPEKMFLLYNHAFLLDLAEGFHIVFHSLDLDKFNRYSHFKFFFGLIKSAF